LLSRALHPRVSLPVLLLLAIVLIFTSLDNRYLWDDEAETALLARNVLRFGVPVAWDGRDLVSQECGHDYGKNYLWRQTPWLPIYLTAASFGVLGESTWSARLPFALLGLATLASLYVVGCMIFRDRAIGILAVLVLTSSVPFLLHVRQARYYAVAIFVALWVVALFFAVVRGSRAAVAGLTVAVAALFLSSHLGAAAIVAGLGAALVVLRPDGGAYRRLAVVSLGSVAMSAPWIALMDIGGKSSVAWSLGSAATFLTHLADTLRWTELYGLPSLALLPILGWWLWRRRAELTGGRTALALGALVAVHLVVVALAPWQFFRYLVTLLPVWALLLAWTIRTFARSSRVLAAAVLVFALAADRADLARGTIGSPLAKYLDEIGHDFDGPIEAIVRHVRAEGQPGDRMFISYGDLPLRFYSSLTVRGGQGCEASVLTPLPDWIVVRHFFRFRNPSPGSADDMARVARDLRDQVPWSQYRAVELSTVDTIWENIPEPDWHVYRTPGNGRRVTIHRRHPSAPSRLVEDTP
jgi:4-amino-4-deoxy-L-arabinose transferase-like glycosyltransferase